MILAHIDAAHWVEPFGWLYRNTPGNLAASVIWGIPALGGIIWRVEKHFKKVHAHNDAVRRHLGIEEHTDVQ